MQRNASTRLFARAFHLLAIAALLAAFFGAAVPVARAATTLYVSPSGDDTNDCLTPATACKTIGAAIGKAAAGDAIVIGAGTYVENLTIDKNVSLSGAGTSATVIDGGGINGVIRILSATSVNIFRVTIRNGFAASGGGISNAGILVLEQSIVSGNVASSPSQGLGGGISNSGALTLNNSIISGNTATDDTDTHGLGGGINNDGTLTLNNSTISDNNSFFDGGGIQNQGNLTITNSTLSNNRASVGGGGIFNNGTVTLSTSTASGNTANLGGALLNDSEMTLQDSTVSDNTATGRAGGIFSNSRSGVNVQNTIVAGNLGPGDSPDCSGDLISKGYNLVGDDTGCTITSTTGDQIGNSDIPIDPLLGPLADNGGPTQTRALLAGSPAREAGNPDLPGSGGTACLTTDQRGVARPQGARCDIGAFEAANTIFVVDTTADPGDADCTLDSCSLRAAIVAANASPNVSSPDMIRFDIPIEFVGPQTIVVSGTLPSITDPVIIDGTTQPGYAGAPLIELSGAAPDGDGLHIAADGSTVKGLAIGGFGNGILLEEGSGNTVAGNYIGIDANGAAAENIQGIEIRDASGNTIGGPEPGDRNVISGNNQDGLLLNGTTISTTIQGNYIGTNPAGNSAIANGFNGVDIQAANNQVVGNLIGGNVNDGVAFQLGGGGNVIKGNLIGVGADGATAIPNRNGVEMFSDPGGQIVGGAGEGDGNLIAFNSQQGVAVVASPSNIIAGNTIRYNGQNGVLIQSSGNTVGGAVAGARNVISRNVNDGVHIEGAGAISNTLQGNYIGTDATGAAPLSNSANGVHIVDAQQNTIASNLISGNDGEGVRIDGFRSTGNLVQGNDIGVSASGTEDLGNANSGVYIRRAGQNSVIGNVVSGNNGFAGITICGTPTFCGGGEDTGLSADAAANIIKGNIVGLNATGTGALGNTGYGISLDGAPDTVVGGAAAGEANVVSSNGSAGIVIFGTGADGNIIRGNYIGTDAGGTNAFGNAGPGVAIQNGSDNTISGSDVDSTGPNVIMFNNGPGIQVSAGTRNELRINHIDLNSGIGIDLDSAGVTANDPGDGDAGPNNLQNYPILTGAAPLSGATGVAGRLSSTAGTTGTYTIDFFASPTCDPSGYGEGRTFLGTLQATTDISGNVEFGGFVPIRAANRQFVTATATDAAGNTSEFSRCVVAGPNNDAWPRALALDGSAQKLGLHAATDGYIDLPDQSRWFSFTVQPSSTVILQLTNLPANYDMVLYKDIAAAYNAISSTKDLEHLGAEFADDAFSPDKFSADAFSPDKFSADAFTPDKFSPDKFSPDVYSPDKFSPDIFSPDKFSPDKFSADAFSPDKFSPDKFSPDKFSPDKFSLDQDAYASAQTRSIIAASGFEGTTSEGIIVRTWDNDGNFYVRVRGRNGAYSLNAPFHLDVTVASSGCERVDAGQLPPTSISPAPGAARTLILTDRGRLALPQDVQNKLDALRLRPEVNGAIVDVGADARVAAANALADDNVGCPYAKNLVADAIKTIVERYRAANPALEYLVFVGNDDVIPFFRMPDQALLGNEKNYIPPVRDATASQASLRLGYVLSQDPYSSQIDLSLKTSTLPIPDLAVGRLVETPAEIGRMLDAYLSTPDGIVATPGSALVTGYDFLEDGATAVQTELAAGLGVPPSALDTLIVSRTIAPQDPRAWTADQLRTKLLGSRHDLVYLDGHFSAGSMLAADYSTRLLASDVASSTLDMTNALIFSGGCHSSYNIVNEHGIPGVTFEPDWAQAFARKGATLIAGTGYQYGDTDFVEYGERLYQDFSRELRAGSGPIVVGKALIAAKQQYLADTKEMRGIHEKTVLIATLYGLPMLRVNMPAGRGGASSSAAGPPHIAATAPTTYTTEPGRTLGLAAADLTVTPVLISNTILLSNPSDIAQKVAASYFARGADPNEPLLPTVAVNPAEPVLPLIGRDVTVPGTVLRGVGFRGGAYTDYRGVRPLTGAATTEIRGVHPPFFSDIFYPARPWNANYFDALTRTGGATRLLLTPAQYKSEAPGAVVGTLRRFDLLDFRLFYSNNIQRYPTSGGTVNIPALSAAPAIARVTATSGGGAIVFHVNVVGDPAAGIQEVWVTYTDISDSRGGVWQSLDLVQNPNDSTLWIGALASAHPENIRYMVQAVNGVGLVTLATNVGAYYTPDVDPAGPPTDAQQPSALALEQPPAIGTYGAQVSLSASLSSGGSPLGGQPITFSVGDQSIQATTDAGGRAAATLTLLGLPGPTELRASFAGSSEFTPTFAISPFTIAKQDTILALTPPNALVPPGATTSVVAALQGATSGPLGQKTVFFVVSGSGGSYSAASITDYAGRAPLGPLPLATGSYSVSVYFSGEIPLPGHPIALSDESYNPATATGSLIITSVQFPSSPLLDDFNRRNGGLGQNWGGGQDADRIVNHRVDVGENGPLYWWGGSSLGVDQEAFVTLSEVDPNGEAQALLLKVQPDEDDGDEDDLANWREGAIRVTYDARANGGAGAVRVETFQRGRADWIAYTNMPVTLHNGDQLGARVLASGEVSIFKNSVLVATVTLNADDQSFFNSRGGRIGLWFIYSIRTFFDDFGGGNVAP